MFGQELQCMFVWIRAFGGDEFEIVYRECTIIGEPPHVVYRTCGCVYNIQL